MHLTPILLENDHVRLEPLREDHREILRPLAQEEEIWAFNTLLGHGAHFDGWFDWMLDQQIKGEQISYGVYCKAYNSHVGHSAYMMIAPPHARVEIGWTWYEARARGTRVNPAAKHALLSHAFACGAARVELKTHHKNLRSQAAMTKMGAVREGTLRSHTLTWTGERRDTVYFSILADEWPKVKEGLDVRL
ncbi:GNAT family N-acetyltransferase [Woodsholea maritima]|uniref:GNAT family N-acetyltransferase n=1 Tax=Woodsholea maritima TaxID=240237 RepID=UPI00037285C2|nr:GNAT family protein [Woodsholea maritima]